MTTTTTTTATQADNIRVTRIAQADERTLAITWTDGRSDLFDVVELRRRCPCANCIDEWTHQPRLRPEDVADTVRPVRLESVGSYALRIAFNDGHSTGIYTFQMLRSLPRSSN
jgi:DUF971 family protein